MPMSLVLEVSFSVVFGEETIKPFWPLDIALEHFFVYEIQDP